MWTKTPGFIDNIRSMRYEENISNLLMRIASLMNESAGKFLENYKLSKILYNSSFTCFNSMSTAESSSRVRKFNRSTTATIPQIRHDSLRKNLAAWSHGLFYRLTSVAAVSRSQIFYQLNSAAITGMQQYNKQYTNTAD